MCAANSFRVKIFLKAKMSTKRRHIDIRNATRKEKRQMTAEKENMYANQSIRDNLDILPRDVS